MSTEVVVRPPEIPSKYDIIPIHGSDVASFKRCRRYWDWSSPTRSNLRRNVSIYGINMPLWFGNGIHFALEKHYDPLLKHDLVESFLTWFQFQWEGGFVSEEWLDIVYDLHPRAVAQDVGDLEPALYKVLGLRDILPNPEAVEDDFQAHKELGVGMLKFYKTYAERNDDFVVVAAESTYSIPLGFWSIDRREESPNYKKSLEVHARGKRDAVIYFPETGKYGIIDHKTAVRIDDTYFAKLDKDEQCSNYLWATKMEADMHDFPWSGKVVDRVIYNALRKNSPTPPTITTRGFPSLDRQNEGTTAELFSACIADNENLQDWFARDEKAQAYYNYLVEQGDSLFIQRDIVTRNKYEVAATGQHLRMIASEMLNHPNIYPNPTGEFRCITCTFRSPCIAADDGSDWKGMLADGYEQNRDR